MKFKFTNQNLERIKLTKTLWMVLFLFACSSSFSQIIIHPSGSEPRKYVTHKSSWKKNNENPSLLIQSSNTPLLQKKAAKKKLDLVTSEDWDGTAYVGSDKTEYTYTTSGKVASETYSYWDEDLTAYVKESQNRYTYDANGNQLTEDYYYWDEDINKFEIGTRTINTYNAKNKLISTTYSEYDFDLLKLVNVNKTDNTYDAKDLLISSLYYVWNTTKNKFDNYLKSELIYNSNDLPVTLTASQWNTTVWLIYAKRGYTYDANKNNNYAVQLNWNTATSKFDTSNKTIVVYNSNSHRVLTRNEVLNPFDKTWDTVQFYTNAYTYDTKMNILTNLLSDWDFKAKMFVKFENLVKTYDSKNNSVTEILYNWDEFESKWVEEEKYSYDHDNAFETDQLILPFTDASTINDYFKTKLNTETYYLWGGTNWELDSRTTFTYSDFTAGIIKQESLNTLTLLPNPATQNFRLDMPNQQGKLLVNISDLSGKTILSQSFEKNEMIDISALSLGAYFVNIFDGNNLLDTKKLIKSN